MPRRPRRLQRVDIRRGIADAVAADARRFEHDRQKTVGGSEVFGCHRQVFFAKHHPELAEVPEEPDWGILERGNVIEEFAVKKLRSMFGEQRCFLMGDDQRTLFDDHLSVTPDGMVIDLERTCLKHEGIPDIGSHELVTEVKSADPNTNLDGKPKMRHYGQNICQMGAIQRNMNYQPQYGVVLYFNPCNLQDMMGSPFFVKYDDEVYQRAKIRAAAVFEPGKKVLDFPAEGKWLDECRYCSFQGPCRRAEAEAYPDKVVPIHQLNPALVQQAEQLIRQLNDKRKESGQMEAEKKQLSAQLQGVLNTLGTNRLSAVGEDGLTWSCSYIRVKGRTSLDTDAMEEDGIVLTDYQKIGDPYFQFRTKVG